MKITERPIFLPKDIGEFEGFVKGVSVWPGRECHLEARARGKYLVGVHSRLKKCHAATSSGLVDT